MNYIIKHKPNIILVHGLFMHGLVMTYLNKFLIAQGYPTTIFSYHTVLDDIEKSATALKSLMETQTGKSIIVCHSLGGLLTQKSLTMMDHPETKVLKVISMGTPWQGASVLTFMKQYRLDGIVGKSLNILLPHVNHWSFPNIPLGSIAGQATVGARMIFAPRRNIATDGTVTIEETKIDGMTDHTVIPVSHTALIFSQQCAKKILQFIESNSFE